MRFLGVLILLFSFACNQNTKEQQTINLLKNRLRERESRLTKLIQDSIKNSKLTRETIDLKKDLADCRSNLEMKKVDLPLRILPTFRMHKDEVLKQDLKRNWIGLFSNEAGYYTKSVEVNFTRVNDPISDSEDEKTGWKPEIKNVSDSCLYLISELGVEEAEMVKHIDVQPRPILPGDTLEIEFSSHTYQIFASGRQFNPNKGWFGTQYTLYFQRDQNEPQMLIYEPTFDDEMIDILWIGDIDKDGYLDLILDSSNHYNVMELSLYLSSYSYGDNILNKVAVQRMVGC